MHGIAVLLTIFVVALLIHICESKEPKDVSIIDDIDMKEHQG